MPLRLLSKPAVASILGLLGAAFLAGTRVQQGEPHIATAGIGMQPMTSDDARELRAAIAALQESIFNLNTRLSRLEGAK